MVKFLQQLVANYLCVLPAPNGTQKAYMGLMKTAETQPYINIYGFVTNKLTSGP